MPHPFPTSLTFYPSYCYPLSPTYNAWVRLTAADVHALRERAGYEGTPTSCHHAALFTIFHDSEFFPKEQAIVHIVGCGD